MRKIVSLIVLCLGLVCCLFLSESNAGFVRTCMHPDRGNFKFGIAPTGCDASQYGDTRRSEIIYKDFIFDRREESEDARRTYMTSMVNLVSKMARDYYLEREPKAPSEEVEVFARAVLSVAHVESFFSHYRYGTDGRLKIMTGDKQVSHGMMQINQTYHADDEQDNSYDLVGNLSFGIELFYQEFQRARKINCLGKKEMQKLGVTAKAYAYARSAYGAYNGGPGSLCRFANTNHLHDRNYREKYQTQLWATYNRDAEAEVNLQYKCILDGDDLCAVAEEYKGQYLAGRPLLLENGLTCFWQKNGSYNCAQDLRSFQCSNDMSVQGIRAVPVRLKKFDAGAKVVVAPDRTESCSSNVTQLAQVGGYVRAAKDIRVRDEVNGSPIGFVKGGHAYQVLDYEIVKKDGMYERYYMVAVSPRVVGYVYGGNDSNLSSWMAPVSGKQTVATKLLPEAGDTVQIVAKEGAWLLQTAKHDEKEKDLIPAWTKLKVESVKIRGNTNEVYIEVNSASGHGYIYVGQTYPSVSVSKWVKVVAP